MKKLDVRVMSVALAGLLSACTLGSTDANIGMGSDLPIHQLDPVDPNVIGETGNGNNGNGNGGGGTGNSCDVGKSYTGFAGTVLEVGRVNADIGLDRARVKPYSALSTEYNRVLGNNPALLASSATTFDGAPARWFMEPKANAVSLYTAYRIAFQGCLTATNVEAKYNSLPSNSTAEAECRSWARKFWSREATTDEVNTCVKTAMVDTVTEGGNPTTARRRWAYTCAAVLSAAGFLTY